MTLETKEFTVGAHTYVVEQFGAKKARGLTVRLARLLAHLAADPSKALASPTLVDDLEIASDAVIASSKIRMATFYQGRTREVLEPLARVWDEHFAGKPDELMALTVLALNWNFAPLLQGGGELATIWPQLSPQAQTLADRIRQDMEPAIRAETDEGAAVPIRSSGGSPRPNGSA